MTPEEDARLREQFEATLARWEVERRARLPFPGTLAEWLDRYSPPLPDPDIFPVRFIIHAGERYPQVAMPSVPGIFKPAP